MTHSLILATIIDPDLHILSDVWGMALELHSEYQRCYGILPV